MIRSVAGDIDKAIADDTHVMPKGADDQMTPSQLGRQIASRGGQLAGPRADGFDSLDRANLVRIAALAIRGIYAHDRAKKRKR